jgi:hypothetical protein
MSHLAGVSREATERLTSPSESHSFARASPGWLRGLRALTGGLSLMIGRGYDQRANLTSRFIKLSTGIIVKIAEEGLR